MSSTNMKKLLVFLLMVINCHATTCAPLTFNTLTKLAGKEVTFETWYQELMPTGNPGILTDDIKKWNERFFLMPLKCVYNIIPDPAIKVEEDDTIKFNIPYVWIGAPPKEWVDPTDTKSQGHMALLYMTKEDFFIIHTLEPGKYYVETISRADFFKRTWVIYKVQSALPIQWSKRPETTK